jgi:HD-GYP domain-containing protein (c-di-GMP phosphodiesterase class II)
MPFQNLFHHDAHKVKLPLSINTWNHEVIAREGEFFTPELLAKVAEMGKQFKISSKELTNCFIVKDFIKLLERENSKYGFLVSQKVMYKRLISHIEKMCVSSRVMMELEWLKKNYNYNYHHILGVMGLVTRMALDFGWPEEEIQEAIMAAMVFDIGIGHIPVEVIMKVSDLSKTEREMINLHPVYSALLTAYYFHDRSHPLVDIVLNHHENLDKSGYPRAVENKNLISNMIRAADLIDALISERPFRIYFSTKEALEICENEIDRGKIMREVFPLLFYYLRVMK